MYFFQMKIDYYYQSEIVFYQQSVSRIPNVKIVEHYFSKNFLVWLVIFLFIYSDIIVNCSLQIQFRFRTIGTHEKSRYTRIFYITLETRKMRGYPVYQVDRSKINLSVVLLPLLIKLKRANRDKNGFANSVVDKHGSLPVRSLLTLMGLGDKKSAREFARPLKDAVDGSFPFCVYGKCRARARVVQWPDMSCYYFCIAMSVSSRLWESSWYL